ncbi:MAG: outer membrane lipoprotein carrier protein LolA [Nitrosomonadales bacterium]|nr:outer membrane lipoprotein carrier protein LolA [Nitrosomonadales bacterium]
MMRSLFMLLCLIPVFVHAEAESSVAATEWGLPQLMQSLAQVQSSQGRFVERKHLAVLDVPLASSGTLSFRAPGHLEKRTLEPRDESLVLDQGVLTIENRTRNIKRTLVVQQYPAVWAFVESIRSTLAGDLPMLERFYKVELKGNAAKWRLKLLPLEQRTRGMVKEIVISGRSDRVTVIEMLEANGDRATMTVTGETP